ncbi:carbohydrate-binding protein [Hymenobacter sp. 5516J-16]|uniref:carbohydrate-binding protein n=1 Tax=Hymenobacter sp. 5516J-16 TaxID=2932253 RepID=UPI001FD4E26A|nr:carbohydrate-binding protein [Hymenobacter sp. 5516J-16]UOQ79163.1 carbohydrate-binding protein [Hymenobacter sp. 5516J-16]
MDAGDWMAYNAINFPTTGTYTIEYRVASPSGGTLSSDLNAGAIQLGNTTIPATGGWQNWTTVSRTVTVNAGTYNFGVFAQTGGWNLNWIRITKAAARPAAITATAATTEQDKPFSVYPNPYAAGSALTIQLPTADLLPTQVQILDAQGKQVWQTTAFGSEVKVGKDLPLRSGLYLIQVSSATGKSVQKLVVQ